MSSQQTLVEIIDAFALEAQRQVFVCMLNGTPEDRQIVRTVLIASDFARVYRSLFAAMVRLDKRCEHISPLSIEAETKRGEGPTVDAKLVQEIEHGKPPGAWALEYREWFRRREIKHIALHALAILEGDLDDEIAEHLADPMNRAPIERTGGL